MQEIRCAIYTRKSTDEGLEKEFNTLEAQREAGENYIRSQKHQGWVIIEEHYDDGGFSGGNMNRPALKRLFSDIKAGKIDMIVVYKIDRLTRSLMDFSKMVEIFDRYNCSFVSVTQNFNTSDSMGRLTLNMLLSFAQFEREIGAERVRDKIEASRKKGMWTGGVVPLGYMSENKKLVPHPQNTEIVRLMFESYIRYKSVQTVCRIVSEHGYPDYRREVVRHILSNPVYIGKIKHKDKLYDGIHQPIISSSIFEQVQELLKNKDQHNRCSTLYKNNDAGLLSGLLTCGCCRSAMTPATSQGNGIRRYYYTSTKAKYYGYHKCHNGAVPVPVLDECIMKIITPLISDIKVLNGLIKKITLNKTAEVYKAMRDPSKLLQRLPECSKRLLIRLLITGIVVQYDTLEINWTDLALTLLPNNLKEKTLGHTMIIDLPFVRHKGALILSLPEDIAHNVNYNNELIKALGRAFKYQKILNEGKLTIVELAMQEEIDSGYLCRLIRLTCLAPDIIKRILDGTQPVTMCLQRLIRQEIPPIWEAQRKLYNIY